MRSTEDDKEGNASPLSLLVLTVRWRVVPSLLWPGFVGGQCAQALFPSPNRQLSVIPETGGTGGGRREGTFPDSYISTLNLALGAQQVSPLSPP